ncbi:peptidoglycan binding domain-containing protein, partial [Candidatus Berkelbacteria bacterium]|nr:peptidoglycan binding domain-containing protein [Candidatus Berkelbacteria bacterium]
MARFTIKLKLSRRQKLGLLVSLLAFFAATIAALGLELAYAEKIPPRVKIGELTLGGKNRDQAKSTLEQKIFEYRNDPIGVSLGTDSWLITATDLNIQFEIDKTLDHLFGSGSRIIYLIKGSHSAVELRFDDGKLNEYLDRIGQVTDDPSQDASLKITDTEVVELPEKIGKGIDRELAKRELTERLGQFGVDPITLHIKTLEPTIYQEGLADAKARASELLSHKLTVKAASEDFIIDRDEIASFISYEPADSLVGGKGKNLTLILSED